MGLSNKERKRLRLEKLRQQSEQAKLEYEQKKEKESIQEKETKKSKTKFYGIISAIVLIIVIGGGIFAFTTMAQPGPYDEFAKCLKSKGVEVYGALSWCKYTQAQKAMFGKSFKYLNYKDFSEFPEEEFGKIKTTPTWIINGKVIGNVQSMERLAELTGCGI